MSCLVTLAGYEGDDKPTFSNALKEQIKTLRKQLDKMLSNKIEETKRDFRPLFDTLSDTKPIFNVFPSASSAHSGERDFRVLLDRIQQGTGNMPELMAQIDASVADTRRMLATMPTPSAWDSSHTHIAGLGQQSTSPKLD